MNRRDYLRRAGRWPLLGLAGGLLSGPAAGLAGDYRALVVVHLVGGNDGSNCLVPTDAAYADYARARGELALPRDSLLALDGPTGEHRLGLHPALAPLAPLYARGRLAWLLNAGPLEEPVTARQVIEGSVAVPPMLMSHVDQQAIQQGWEGGEDPSGWAGRALELLPAPLRHGLAGASFDSQRTLVLGRNTPVSWIGEDPGALNTWGRADLSRPGQVMTQVLREWARPGDENAYRAEYARTLERQMADAAELARAVALGPVPATDFGPGALAGPLRTLARLLPAFATLGYRRQVFLVSVGGFDTHAAQRGSAIRSQDTQLDLMARALAGFDAATLAAGLDAQVATLVISDFGRTLRPTAGGSDHGWGNHWWAFGGPVAGRQAIGRFPQLVLGGPDDADPGAAGRLVPTLATDQVGAALMRWMGLEAERLPQVFQRLSRFDARPLGLLQA